ncbi:hypothetical protein CYMTET_52106 [Cymbomonas tetramitiformis]|uniref:Uncharacterized protein n=1 Tax=Cymbomonas tetramitiformis TaxID=36881 RepID=A0AAE0ERZ5_9CHLO|nr:hypothetical protein CYMTET_52106 [Cymbomonas tetramitiformis]
MGGDGGPAAALDGDPAGAHAAASFTPLFSSATNDVTFKTCSKTGLRPDVTRETPAPFGLSAAPASSSSAHTAPSFNITSANAVWIPARPSGAGPGTAAAEARYSSATSARHHYTQLQQQNTSSAPVPLAGSDSASPPVQVNESPTFIPRLPRAPLPYAAEEIRRAEDAGADPGGTPDGATQGHREDSRDEGPRIMPRAMAGSSPNGDDAPASAAQVPGSSGALDLASAPAAPWGVPLGASVVPPSAAAGLMPTAMPGAAGLGPVLRSAVPVDASPGFHLQNAMTAAPSTGPERGDEGLAALGAGLSATEERPHLPGDLPAAASGASGSTASRATSAAAKPKRRKRPMILSSSAASMLRQAPRKAGRSTTLGLEELGLAQPPRHKGVSWAPLPSASAAAKLPSSPPPLWESLATPLYVDPEDAPGSDRGNGIGGAPPVGRDVNYTALQWPVAPATPPAELLTAEVSNDSKETSVAAARKTPVPPLRPQSYEKGGQDVYCVVSPEGVAEAGAPISDPGSRIDGGVPAVPYEDPAPPAKVENPLTHKLRAVRGQLEEEDRAWGEWETNRAGLVARQEVLEEALAECGREAVSSPRERRRIRVARQLSEVRAELTEQGERRLLRSKRRCMLGEQVELLEALVQAKESGKKEGGAGAVTGVAESSSDSSEEEEGAAAWSRSWPGQKRGATSRLLKVDSTLHRRGENPSMESPGSPSSLPWPQCHKWQQLVSVMPASSATTLLEQTGISLGQLVEDAKAARRYVRIFCSVAIMMGED